MTFDPSSDQAVHWRTWASTAPGDSGKTGVVRLLLGIRWQAEHTKRHAHAEVDVPLRRALGLGWSSWPTYLVSLRPLKSFG